MRAHKTQKETRLRDEYQDKEACHMFIRKVFFFFWYNWYSTKGEKTESNKIFN